MKSNLVTLDRRHAGYGIWKYYVNTPLTQHYRINKNLFFKWRTWCWDTWGASKEMTEYSMDDLLIENLDCSNMHWSWQHDKYAKCRIYLKSDEDASIFVLHWF